MTNIKIAKDKVQSGMEVPGKCFFLLSSFWSSVEHLKTHSRASGSRSPKSGTFLLDFRHQWPRHLPGRSLQWRPPTMWGPWDEPLRTCWLTDLHQQRRNAVGAGACATTNAANHITTRGQLQGHPEQRPVVSRGKTKTTIIKTK